jgi:hypothetical protein
MEETTKTYFIHPLVGSTGGRATLAMKIEPELGRVTLGMSWCSPKDQFCKKKGRMIATGRMVRSDRNFTLTFGTLLDSGITHDALSKILTFTNEALKEGRTPPIPQWAQGESFRLPLARTLP